MKAHIVVGAGFGDEGKGQVVDYLANKYDNCLVVRHNGGAQAAHTVVADDETRHVFHSIGSGALRGADTYLSEYFVFNPQVFYEEYEEKQAFANKIFVNQAALLSTPVDWIINRLLEEERGKSKHGSCGLGINETVVRCQNPEFKTTVGDIYEKDFKEKLERINKTYLYKRLNELELRTPFKLITTMRYYKSTCEVVKHIIVPTIHDFDLDRYKNVIFESAQGLLLDAHNPYFFPYLTRSRTGSANAIEILEKQGLLSEIINTYYVTRTFLTRHGVGPLPFEDAISEPVLDVTNIWNKYQDELRIAPLNMNLLNQAITLDQDEHRLFNNEHLMVTWGKSTHRYVVDNFIQEDIVRPEILYDHTGIQDQVWFNTPKSKSGKEIIV